MSHEEIRQALSELQERIHTGIERFAALSEAIRKKLAEDIR